MPIKFRCDKCRQFLGISRNLAGQIVDCPTCGRSTRVPSLDGTREPISNEAAPLKPDSSLLSALDQLADLGKRSKTQASDVTVADDKPHAIVVQPSEREVPVDPPPQALPKQSRERAPSAQSAINPSVLEELAETAPIESVVEPRNAMSAALIGGACLAGAALFVGGWFVGQRGFAESESGPKPEDQPTERSIPESVPVPVLSGVKGRVTYRKQESDCLPDRGSRVIIWPVGFGPAKPWKADGFRPGDPEPLTEAVRKKLQDAGGDLVVTAEDGTFRAALPTAGDFEILILSRFGGQGIDGQGITAAQSARLKVCFAEPRRLVGKAQFRLIRMKYRGQGQHLFDQVFEVLD
ncbi:MAG: hypothetical protein AB8G99_21750 [Planctomycetaceae bacterium]